jgi:beta-lactamase regulating signal transducer with metallopeptidase domain
MDEIHLSPIMNWLLRASWQGSVVILLVFVFQWVFRQQLSPKWRYRLWLLVLVRLMLPMSPPSALSIFNYLNPQLSANIDQSSTSSEPAVTPTGGAGSTPAVSQPAHGRAGLAGANLKFSRQQYSNTEILLLGLADSPFSAQCLMILLLVVWPAGVVLLVLRILRQNLGFALRVRRTPAVTNPEVLQVLEDCCRLLDIGFSIRLVETKEIKSPGLYGFFRPQLLLPEGMAAAFNTQELNYIFLHELAHVKRLDMAVNWLMTGLQILHWFNPLIWFGFARIRADRELACDALVLSRVREVETESYGQTIIKLLESFVCPPRVSGLVGILEEKEQMKRRITMIACFKRASQVPVLALALFVLLGLVSLTDAKIPELKPKGLVGWWQAEGNASDRLGANHGTLAGSLTYGTGSRGKAFNFNGVDAEVKIAASSSLDVGCGGGFTIDAWINPDGLDQQCPLVEWHSGSGGVSFLVVEDFGPGALYAQITDVQRTNHILVSSGGLIQPYVYQHVAVTYDRLRGMGTLYLNGKVVALTFLGFFEPLTDGDLYFGVRHPGEAPAAWFRGQIDEIQVFNTALTAPEIQTVYRAGVRGRSPLEN